ncbi:unnamed protein product [Nesidiocoris tenuis]|uniref:Carboxylesterase type B domain-containing protein n=1 Tax=Nesidiocoris tenuis TaxID=355587 RepID=A0A6H5FYW0_9HEMI|nr:unnamed protein product [Nesidiocoris tenuis]
MIARITKFLQHLKTGSGLALKYPVMVYIHGGDFIHGASNLFPGHIMAGFYDVVVVTINYRLGALGFLSTGDANSPGNYGLLDQALAIRWIHENIGYFNGDRDSITLFGPDAGAASAGLLMVNPRTRSLIARVIAQIWIQRLLKRKPTIFQALHGSLKYLNLNTTYNSSIFINYRQTESAFWTWYLPTVYWWQPKEPLQIAFWTMSGTNLLLIVVVVIFCILWRNAKRRVLSLFRQQDRFYGTDMLMMGLGNEMEQEMGIENRTQSAGNIYEYRDLPIKHGRRPTSASTPASIRSSDGSLGPGNRDGYATSPNGRPKTPPIKRPISRKSMAGSTTSVPMTQV